MPDSSFFEPIEMGGFPVPSKPIPHHPFLSGSWPAESPWGRH